MKLVVFVAVLIWVDQCFLLKGISAIYLSDGAQTTSSDFDDTASISGYEFIYHDLQNLLLTVHETKCYFTSVLDDSAEEKLLLNHKVEIEEMLKEVIENHPGKVRAATMGQVRETFRDLLANYRCTGHSIYTITIAVQNKTASSGTGGHSHGTGTVNSATETNGTDATTSAPSAHAGHGVTSAAAGTGEAAKPLCWVLRSKRMMSGSMTDMKDMMGQSMMSSGETIICIA